MTAVALAFGAVLACACVLFVALPFLREPDPAEDRLDAPGALEKRALELTELEFDHRTGKISDEDCRELIGPLRVRVAEALRALEPTAQPSVRESGPGEGVQGNREVPPRIANG